MLTNTRYRVSFGFKLFLVALSFVILGPSDVVSAATIIVNTTADELNANGNCSLREAIQAANTDAAIDACAGGSGADTIMVPAGTYVLSLSGSGEDANASGDLDITSDVTLRGDGASTTIIDGARLDRVFHVAAGVTVGISGVTIQNGLAPFEGSLATFGGGILNNGMLTLSGCVIRSNTGAMLDHFGGGIFNDGTLTLNNSSVSDNTAVAGGGVYNSGTAALINSTLNGNTVGASGGGIQNVGTLSVDNSTISGNNAFAGGGIEGVVTIRNSTITANSATFGGGILISGSLTEIKNTIVGKNLSGGDCIGTGVTSLGHNFDGDGTCGFNAASDIRNADPRLGKLVDNGGPTKTHALLAGSLATDAGSSDCPPPSTDQRSVSRPQGVACDIGSFERIPPLAARIDVRPANINPRNEGQIMVALFTTATLRAEFVDPRTVAFGPTGVEAAPIQFSFEDVNQDGQTDLVFHFRTQAAGIACGDTSAVLSGTTIARQMFEGIASIRTVGCR